MTPLETRIRDALQASAELPVTLEEIEQAQARFRSRQPASARRPRAVLVAATASFAVVAVLVWWLAHPAADDARPIDQPTQAPQPTQTTTHTDDRVGIVGPPPPGTAPSGGTGELVAAAELYNSGTWVYADGRIINVEHRSGTSAFKGYVVRQLTPSGVEAMRTFLLDGTPKLTPVLPDAELIVRDSGRLMAARAFTGCNEDLGRWDVQDRSCAAFERPEKWLPASAWEDPTLRPFIPVTFLVCTWFPGSDSAELPARAADIFLASPRHRGAGTDCRDVATPDARTIADALEDAGPDGNGDQRWDVSRDRALAFSLRSDDHLSFLWFEPILPHGEAYGTQAG